MKKSALIIALTTMAAVFLLNSCKKDDDNNNNNNNPPLPTNELSAKIDGVQYNFHTVSGLLDTEDNELWLPGSNSSGQLSLTLNGDITPGTYNNKKIAWDPESGYPYLANPHSIVVTKHDAANRRIEGTFSGTLNTTLPPSLSLTNGVFKITYMKTF